MKLYKQEQLVENIDELDEDLLFEMAKVSKDDSGLKHELWLDNAGSLRINTHNKPRLKIRANNNLIPIIIDNVSPTIPNKVDKKQIKEIEDLKEIKQYIIDNYSILMYYWEQQISDKQVLNMLGDKDDKDRCELMTFLINININPLIREIYSKDDTKVINIGRYRVELSLIGDELFKPLTSLYMTIFENNNLVIRNFEISNNKDKLELINVIK